MQCARDGCLRTALSFSIYCSLHRPAGGTMRRRSGAKKKAPHGWGATKWRVAKKSLRAAKKKSARAAKKGLRKVFKRRK